MTYKKALEEAKNLDSQLRSTDFSPEIMVSVSHEDGTNLYFRCALIFTLSGNYMAVCTEHHGFHVYDADEAEIIEWRINKP